MVKRLLSLSLVLVSMAALLAQEPDSLPGGTMVRGTIATLAPNSVTLHTEDGDTVTVAVTANTRIVHERQPARFADLQVGDGVGAGGILDPATHTLHAAFLGFVDAAEVRKAEADLGKTYIVGRITAIDLDHLHLTVHRPDNTDQTIAVDESTSFRRGGHSPGPDTPASSTTPQHPNAAPQPPRRPADSGEPITLADIHTGESIAARGSIKNGLFTPTELHVFTPHSRSGSAATSTNSGARP